MKKNIFSILIVVAMLASPGVAFAKAVEWEIDKGHSSIYFDIRHTFATVRGLFNDFSGTLIFDPENKDASRIEIEVKVDSINTNIAKRDNHLRSNDFFAAKEFPLMTFKSSRIQHVKGNQYIIDGDLTIKGITKAVSIPFTYFGTRENPLKKGQTVAGFEADFTIDRLEYKVGSGQFYEMGAIGKDVRIIISIEALK